MLKFAKHVQILLKLCKKSEVNTYKMPKNNLKKLEDSKPRIIETIEKINPKI